MAKKRNAEAIWIESQSRWLIKVQKDGVRRSFVSSIKGRKGKHAAEAKADIWLEEGTTDMRFPAAWAAFLAYQKKQNGTDNYKKHESLGRLYIAPIVGSYKLSSITPAMWQQCLEAGADAGLARRSCSNIRLTITAFLNFCESNRWQHEDLKKNDLSVPNRAPAPKKKQILQADDIRTLFHIDTVMRYRKAVPAFYIHAWRLYVATGLRRGELCGLRREDVVHGLLTVNRSINRHGEETTGKNDNARRTIAISQTAQMILSDQATMLRQMGIVSPWVFPDENGKRSDPNSIYKHWLTYRNQHDIHSNIHELRHTFVSVNKIDMPIELLKATVGHSSQMDTVGVYGHEMDGEKERAAQIVDTVFGRILDIR